MTRSIPPSTPIRTPPTRGSRALGGPYHNEEQGFWALSRFKDVLRAVHDPQTFCSSQGITIGPPPTALLPMMIMMDPPRHDRLRSLVSRAFTPRAIAALEPRVHEIAAGLATELVEQGDGDFVTTFAEPLPTMVIAELLGVDTEDRAFFKAKSNQLVRQNHSRSRAARKVSKPPRRSTSTSMGWSRIVGPDLATTSSAR